MARTIRTELTPVADVDLDVGAIYEEQVGFVWRSLHRLGVAEADLPDLTQEVFVVLHRRRGDYDGRAIRGWLWGIALGLVRNYRRRSTERPTDRWRERVDAGTPEEALDQRRMRRRGQRLLSDLDPEKRAVFVMFEVEGLSGRAIAEQLALPLGTVHSRLHAARRELAAALADEEQR